VGIHQCSKRVISEFCATHKIESRLHSVWTLCTFYLCMIERTSFFFLVSPCIKPLLFIRHFLFTITIIITIIIILFVYLFVCLLLGINVFFLQCLPLIRLWFYVVFVHNVITCTYTVLCL
jgi:hypothetical protein